MLYKFEYFVVEIKNIISRPGGERSGVRLEYRLPVGRRVKGDQVQGVNRIIVLHYADNQALLAENEGSLRMGWR